MKSIDDVFNSLNFKFYNNQTINDDYVSKVLNSISYEKNDSLARENSLIKLSMLINNNRNLIEDSLKKKTYDLLEKNISEKNRSYLVLFDSLNIINDTLKSSTKRSSLPPTNSVYAGIEVGSSAVKLSVLEFVTENNNSIYFRSLCEPQTIQINSRLYNSRNYDDIAKKVQQFYSCVLSDFHLSNQNIFVGFSSGFCNNFIVANKATALDSVDLAIHHLVNDAFIKHLLPEEESAYTHLGLIQTQSLRYRSLVIDIGNGNTKGGFYTLGSNRNPSPRDFTPFYLNWASGSLKSIIDKKIGTGANITQYYDSLIDYLNRNKNDEIGDRISNTRGIANKNYVYFSGGISWVISTLLQPSNPHSLAVEITKKDIQDFILKMTDSLKFESLLDKARNDYGSNNKNISTSSTITCVECKTPEFIFDVFDQKLCIAGAEVMLESINQLSSSGVPKRYFVTSNGKLAWIMAYVLSSID